MLCLLALLAAGVAGCGGGDDEGRDPRAAVEAFVQARNGDDFAAECGLYTPDFKEQLGVGKACAEFLEESRSGLDDDRAVEIVDVRERDGRAQAELDIPGEGADLVRITLLLEREDGKWRIAAIQ